MKKSLAVIAALLLAATPAAGLGVPALTGRVNDLAGMISASARVDLESRLADFERTDSTQVVVVTIPSLEGEVLEEFSIKVAEAWRIGQAGKDNGIIFLVSRDDRLMRIEVGRGLEGRLTDLLAGRIIDQVVKPRFKAGDYDGGFAAGVEAIIGAVRGEFKAEPGADPIAGPLWDKMPFYLITSLFFSGLFIRLLRVKRIIGALMVAVGLPLSIHLLLTRLPLLGFLILGLVGFILGLIMASVPAFSPGRHSRSSGWSGGSSRSGGGGGFGGGGGSFGGGGASGGW
jgi:uncharacterized protein